MHADQNTLLLALAILAHALVGRVPPWRWVPWAAAVVLVLALLLVLWMLFVCFR